MMIRCFVFLAATIVLCILHSTNGEYASNTFNLNMGLLTSDKHMGPDDMMTLLRHTCHGSWEEKASFPLAVTGASSFTIGDKAYVGSGATGEDYCPGELAQDFYYYSADKDSWTQIAPMPESRVEATGFTMNGKGYIFGGRNATCHNTNSLFEYSPSTDSWKELHTKNFPPPPQHDLMSFVIDNVAYVGLGFAKHGAVRQFYTFNGFDWEGVLPSYPHNVGGAFMFRSGERIFVGGGIHQKNKELDVNFYEFEHTLSTRRWTKLSSIPIPVGEGIGFSVGEYGFVGTGYQDMPGHTYRREIYRYSIAANSWDLVGNYPEGEHLDGTTFQVGGRAFAGLGLKAFSFEKTSTIYEYKPI